MISLLETLWKNNIPPGQPVLAKAAFSDRWVPALYHGERGFVGRHVGESAFTVKIIWEPIYGERAFTGEIRPAPFG